MWILTSPSTRIVRKRLEYPSSAWSGRQRYLFGRKELLAHDPRRVVTGGDRNRKYLGRDGPSLKGAKGVDRTGDFGNHWRLRIGGHWVTVPCAEVCCAHDRATQLGPSPWKGRVWEIVSRPGGGRQLCWTPGVDVGALSRGWGHVGDSLGAKMPSRDAGGRQHRGSVSSFSVQQGYSRYKKPSLQRLLW